MEIDIVIPFRNDRVIFHECGNPMHRSVRKQHYLQEVHRIQPSSAFCDTTNPWEYSIHGSFFFITWTISQVYMSVVTRSSKVVQTTNVQRHCQSERHPNLSNIEQVCED